MEEHVLTHSCRVCKAIIPITRIKVIIDEDGVEYTTPCGCLEFATCINYRKAQGRIVVSLQDVSLTVHDQLKVDKSTEVTVRIKFFKGEFNSTPETSSI